MQGRALLCSRKVAFQALPHPSFAALRPPSVFRNTTSTFSGINSINRPLVRRSFASTSKPDDASFSQQPQYEYEKAAAEEQYEQLNQFGLSKHEQSLFRHEEEELPSLPDHGFRFYTSPDQLQDRNEPVKRALSTRTASLTEYRRFKRQQIINKYRTDMFDTGSSRVQVALLTERIQALTDHLRRHRHDTAAKREVQRLLVRRRKLMQYMIRNDYTNYRVVVRELGLRPVPLFLSKYVSHRGNKEPHSVIRARHGRIKKRSQRGHKGH
eukprot:gb/GECG01001828.1/.p1 GENE.gb/GECG01001828.1/~~gb/GECG01001828.1/.p1  ORF type:complete len:268 (+),score=25.25 gb/GECG01001828.1/:1-804(+)